MNTYYELATALESIIQMAYHIETMKWYRIRRQCLKRGLSGLAERILRDIHKAERDIRYYDFRGCDYYEFMFQIGNPYRVCVYHTRPSEYDGE